MNKSRTPLRIPRLNTLLAVVVYVSSACCDSSRCPTAGLSEFPKFYRTPATPPFSRICSTFLTPKRRASVFPALAPPLSLSNLAHLKRVRSRALACMRRASTSCMVVHTRTRQFWLFSG
ncbi:hypothetical protein L227DRAFT_306397 [Lentinus tigrinus ALCF2SS1-6]|uniref:Secreted protein n=1 Tax=Lentinus tigrinus ALCF2SS1-6 TaxID=1328759 RepID=A0A5C2RWR9_9APHY|nr:hypothetical protein L227DRAFT_306397 [Lentinus tigrinus ALCF2SS1-6]